MPERRYNKTIGKTKNIKKVLPMSRNHTRTIVFAALLAALTTVATMVIRIPTPTQGYIHLGDGMVLICGVLLGPGLGALAAGVGSMLADLIGGYMAYVPGTFAIKALTALAAGWLVSPHGGQCQTDHAGARRAVRHPGGDRHGAGLFCV